MFIECIKRSLHICWLHKLGKPLASSTLPKTHTRSPLWRKKYALAKLPPALPAWRSYTNPDSHMTTEAPASV